MRFVIVCVLIKKSLRYNEIAYERTALPPLSAVAIHEALTSAELEVVARVGADGVAGTSES